MKKSFPPKHLPIPVGLALLSISLILGVVFINKGRNLNLLASPQTSPQQVKITNIGNSSFIVSWATADKTTGLILAGETAKPDEIRKDVRDQSNTGSFSLHFVVVDNLRPQTKYYFRIIAGGKTYDNSQKPYEVTTAAAKVPPDHDIATGKILTPAGQPAAGAIVYLSLANAVPQAALTDDNGNWLVPLSSARTLDLTDFSHYDREAQIEEIVVKGEEGNASATLTSGNDNPAPDIILGQSYNFLNQLAPSLTPSPQSSAAAEESASVPPKITTSPESLPLSITFPAEGEEVNSPLPEFMGTGPNGEKLDIVVESEEEITSFTAADQKGKWSWSPKLPLSPGEHKITLSYLDKDGTVQKVSRSFQVLAAGESNLPSFTATPSGETVNPSSTSSPTAFLSPTKRPTAAPTLSAAEPTEEEAAEPTQAIPSTGINLPTKFFFGLGAATLLSGIILLAF